MSMWFLIIRPNIISLLLGWDGLGLTSYALVIFYQREFSCNAGILTVLSNRIGDVAILLRLGLMIREGRWDFYFNDFKYRNMLVILVILAGATKRAQIPFSAWLPAAIAAPTPVSALVHSSTLVTAGVYLLIRFSSIINNSGLRFIILVISAITLVIAGLRAMFERDLKKVVALSTLRQLGVIIIILGAGIRELAFFHLITHAIFKSTLFMCVGFIIHRVGRFQDRRVIGGFRLRRPSLGILLSSTNLALCGFPFLAGFYSKDRVLEHIFIRRVNIFVVIIAIVGTGLTVRYRFRVLYLRSSKTRVVSSVRGVIDINSLVVKRVVGLFVARLVSGFLMYWVVVPVRYICFLTRSQKLFIVVARVLAGVCSYKFRQKYNEAKAGWLKVTEGWVVSIWFLPFLRSLIPHKFLWYGISGNKVIEIGWFEHYGGQGGRLLLLKCSDTLQKSQKRVLVKRYIISIVASMVIIFVIL